ncbi:SdiA-regulated domain-containing protein [Fibrella sp. HMF5335]|uniref:SdiA-regulated domain-containing protein n=1 Tax=Fibrella rubiginis TaxID=2817060 RepID=A0A939GCT6_9BACT|nr:SdiA-regulated domain-containing protein [Fibrella rubiginis]MBO0936589.1 SdiA-regulated domain-containing protein [Fibrella rubiginis]
MRNRITLASLLLLTLFSACKPGKKKTDEADQSTSTVVNEPIPYDLANPAQTHKLPSDLREISGLSYYKPGRLACVQDEVGMVFIYDLAKKAVVDNHVFGPKGDFEGVEYVNKTLYALRSDGELYAFEHEDGNGIKIIGGGPQTRHIKIDLPGKNDMEGLGYDPQLNALLLATKDGPGSDDKKIYFYSLKNKTLFQGFILKQANVAAFGLGDKKFKPSGIAVHPQTHDYYLLSAASNQLLVCTVQGKVKSVIKLDKDLLPQAEGICFLPDGTLCISSEGDGKKGILVLYNMKS